MGKNDLSTYEVAGNNYHDIDSGETTNYYESALRFKHGNTVRWQIEKDNVANADLYIRRYNSSGVLQDSPLKINGADGGWTNTCTAATALTFAGTPTKIISAGSYASMLTHGNNELITVAATDTTGWILGIGSYMRATGEDGYPFAFCGLVESTDTTGTKTLQGCQMMAFLGTPGGSEAAHLKTLGGDATAGMYAAWFKVGANSNCVCDAGSRVAAVWVDNQMSGTISGEEYGIFATTGATKPDAFIGFETTSSGYSNLFYWDETAYDQDPIFSTGTCKVDATKNSTGTIKCDLNGTTVYLGYWVAADLTS